MEGLLKVEYGTVFWATVSFLIVLFILKKFAWGPIVKSLEERTQSIENALNEAERVRKEIANLKAGNEDLLRQARDERDTILLEAKQVKDNIISEAREKAQEDADRIMTSARAEIENRKKAAMVELKNYVATLSIDIAETLVKDKLTDAEKQKALNSKLISEMSSN
jgi:F-type H+-transporting ATPase subunit b